MPRTQSTPRDHRLYLDDILGAIERIQTYVQSMDFRGFAADQRTVDAVVRNLEVIGEAARSLPDPIKDATSAIDWRKIVGLRNILVHEYFGVNAALVWDIVQTKLEPLRTVCREMVMGESQERGEDASDR